MKAYGHTPPTKVTKTVIDELKTQDITSDAGLQETITNIAKKKTMKTLNALKIVNPIIIGLMLNPGEKEDLNESFKFLIKNTADLSSKTCQLLGINPAEEKNFWTRNVFERIFSEICKEQWIKNGKIDTDSLMSLVEELSKNDDFVESKYRELDLPVDLDVKINLVKSMIPVIAEMKSGFDLHRNIQEDIEGVTEVVFNAAKLGMSKIADENADTKQKSDVLKLLIQEGAKLYAVSWKNYAIFAKNYFYQSSEADQKKIKQKYPKGLPIKPIEEDFNNNFDRLLIVTQKIIPARNNAPDKKMK